MKSEPELVDLYAGSIEKCVRTGALSTGFMVSTLYPWLLSNMRDPGMCVDLLLCKLAHAECAAAVSRWIPVLTAIISYVPLTTLMDDVRRCMPCGIGQQ